MKLHRIAYYRATSNLQGSVASTLHVCKWAQCMSEAVFGCERERKLVLLGRRPGIRVNPVESYRAQESIRYPEGTDQGKCMWSQFTA